MQFSKIVSILALAIAADAAVIATRVESTLDVSSPGEIFKRNDGDQYLDVYGSGGSRHAEGSSSLQVSVSCGTIYATNIDSAGGLCTATMVRDPEFLSSTSDESLMCFRLEVSRVVMGVSGEATSLLSH